VEANVLAETCASIGKRISQPPLSITLTTISSIEKCKMAEEASLPWYIDQSLTRRKLFNLFEQDLFPGMTKNVLLTFIYTLTGHFIRYPMLVTGWTHFCLQNCLNSSWHRFNKVLEAFLREFGPY